MSPRTKQPKRSMARSRREGQPRYFSAQVSKAQRFYLDLSPAHGPGLAVVSGGCESCSPDYEIRRSNFPYTTVEFVAGGTGRLWVAQKQYELMPGTIFVYGGHLRYWMKSDAETPLVKYFVAFGGNDARGLLQECQLRPGKVLRVQDPTHIQRVFDDLVGHGLSDNSNRARMCMVALQYLLMKIGDLALPYGEASGAAFATYQQARRYIEEHYLEIHTARDVATGCHVNLSYLCRLFQRFGRQRPNLYLQHLRMNRAAELLQLGHPIKDIAEELRFSDVFSFSRAFWRSLGVRPGRFQARLSETRRSEPEPAA
jgi:AraC-like DNA-binding protein